jgi:signal transduction histidine kinase
MLNNAMKFTESGTITLSAARRGDEIRVSVVDTGVGIAREDHERIFEKFQQVGDTLTDKPRGTGLGLCICRDIIAYHQGRMWVESELGRGSTFTFAVPIPEIVLQPPVRVSQAA